MAAKVRCTKCGVLRRRASFYPSPRKRNGLDSWCKVCRRKASARYARFGCQPREPKPEPPSALSRGPGKGNPKHTIFDTLLFWPAALDLRDPRKLKSREV